MCGIVSYVGRENAVPYLLNSLRKLEYRGYDSSGVALINENALEIIKEQGKISALQKAIDEKGKLDFCCGIAHTRWATHGSPSKENAHPHKSDKGKFTVVHNGIIENYSAIKRQLSEKGVRFLSETDSEVIPNLIEECYEGDFLHAVIKACGKLEGSFAISVLCKDYPDKIVCARRGSPLIVAEGKKGCFSASDITALLDFCERFYKLCDGEFAVIESDKATIFDENSEVIEKDELQPDIQKDNAEKGDFPHFMLKEIYEQPKALKRTLKRFLLKGDFSYDAFCFTKEEFLSFNKIHIVACGSAYHAGLIGKYVFEELCEIPVTCEIASEYRYRKLLCDENTLFIAISQSGETADTLAAAIKAKKQKAKTLCIVNTPSSTLQGECDFAIHTLAGSEIAVATTKAYTCQVGVLYFLGVYLSFLKGKIDDREKKEYINEILSLPEKIEQITENSEDIKVFAEKLYHKEHIYFIGRNTDYPVAQESALKMKEISYIHCEAYPAGELKHGTISLIEEGTYCLAVALREDVFAKTINNIKEIKARNGEVIVVTTKSLSEKFTFRNTITVPEMSSDMFSSLNGIVALQLLSYFVAEKRGCDIDKPRNLAKSVTVE